MSSAKCIIGITGAGIAGLSSGILLQQAGHDVRIFESRSVSGGRIQSQTLFGYVIEAGPEFIHGNAKETIRLLKKYGISYIPANGKMYSTREGQLQVTDDMIFGWDKLLGYMNKLENDLPFGEFLLKYFPGPGYHDLRNSAIGFAEGFDLVDVQTASTQALAAEWLAGESEQYRIPSGYHTLIQSMEQEFISAGGKILFEQIVEMVDWTGKDIRVHVGGHQPLAVQKLVVSLPVPLLNYPGSDFDGLKFNPSPEEQLNAFAQIGYGTVIKLVTIWTSEFWKTRIPDAQFIFSDSLIPTWWTQYPLDQPILTGWLGGPDAEAVSQEPDEFFLNRGLESLSSVFSMSVSELKNELIGFRVFNWKKEIWSRGAYSFATVKSNQLKIVTRNSLERRIYFSGEAFYEGPHPGTVEAAVVSGLETAKQLMAEI